MRRCASTLFPLCLRVGTPLTQYPHSCEGLCVSKRHKISRRNIGNIHEHWRHTVNYQSGLWRSPAADKHQCLVSKSLLVHVYAGPSVSDADHSTPHIRIRRPQCFTLVLVVTLRVCSQSTKDEVRCGKRGQRSRAAGTRQAAGTGDTGGGRGGGTGTTIYHWPNSKCNECV